MFRVSRCLLIVLSLHSCLVCALRHLPLWFLRSFNDITTSLCLSIMLFCLWFHLCERMSGSHGDAYITSYIQFLSIVDCPHCCSLSSWSVISRDMDLSTGVCSPPIVSLDYFAKWISWLIMFYTQLWNLPRHNVTVRSLALEAVYGEHSMSLLRNICVYGMIYSAVCTGPCSGDSVCEA